MAESSSKKAKKAEVVELLKRLEEGSVPDEETRRLMRIQLARRLQWGYKPTYQQQLEQNFNLVHSLRQMDIASETDTLDSQVYEVPISFLKLVFGKKLKESCSYFRDESMTLDDAEIAMLDLYCERAQIKDGQSVLDLGCGQGAGKIMVIGLLEDDVSVTYHWILSGKHFTRNMEEWRNNLDANMDAVREIAESFTGSKEGAVKLINFWRGLCIQGSVSCASIMMEKNGCFPKLSSRRNDANAFIAG